MEDRHFSDEELIDRLYGTGCEDDHTDRCAACGERWRALVERRRGMLAEPEVPEAVLAAQRHAVLARIDRPAMWPRPLAAMALAALWLVGVMLQAPAPKPEPSVAGMSDTQLFADAFAEASRSTPRAVMPVEGLFEVKR